MSIVERLRQHALPDPHDEREVMHAPLLKEAADLIEQQAERIKELERDNAQLKTVPMKYRRMEFNAQSQQRIEELEATLDRLYRVGHCGSVDSFLACDDEVKRGYFAMMIEESTDNKKLREELAALHKRIDDAHVHDKRFRMTFSGVQEISLICREDLQG